MFSRACPPTGPSEVKVKQVGSEPPTLSARAALLLSLVCGSRLRCLGWGWSGERGSSEPTAYPVRPTGAQIRIALAEVGGWWRRSSRWAWSVGVVSSPVIA